MAWKSADCFFNGGDDGTLVPSDCSYRESYRAQVTQGSDNKAPAEQAGIKLALDRNKIENLIKPASKLK